MKALASAHSERKKERGAVKVLPLERPQAERLARSWPVSPRPAVSRPSQQPVGLPLPWWPDRSQLLLRDWASAPPAAESSADSSVLEFLKFARRSINAISMTGAFSFRFAPIRAPRTKSEAR